jgi:hypothetical protein
MAKYASYVDEDGDLDYFFSDNEEAPLMHEMSLKIDKLEAELRGATQKAARHEGQAEAYKQKAEAHKQEAEAHKQEAEALKQDVAFLRQILRDKDDKAQQLLKKNAKRAHAEIFALKNALARAKETLAEKLDALEFEKKECTVCLALPAHVVALPCGHRCFCTNAECSAHVSACPLCRTPIAGTLRIF